MKFSTRAFGVAAMLIFVLFVTELTSFGFYKFFLEQRRFLVYTPPRISREVWDNYLRVRDPVLGWPTARGLNSDRYDASGSRPVPAFPEPGAECVTLYGDSFTYAVIVAHRETWGNLLAESLGCRVGNFGVSGYGTDQALLRFETNEADSAPVSILGIFPSNLMRNVNQYHYLLGSGADFTFKPRFILVDGELELVPKPEPRFSDLHLLGRDPGLLLAHETFLPGSDLGPVVAEFPYTLVVPKLLLNDRVRKWLRNVPGTYDFVEADHPSQALQLTVRIAERFIRGCDDRGKRCLVLLFPGPFSYRSYIERSVPALQPLMEAFERLGIRYLALVRPLAEHLGEKGYCKIVTEPGRCRGHFNAEGNRLVAEIVHAYLVQNSFLQLSGAAPPDAAERTNP